MPGTVYCFNCYNEPMRLSLNGQKAAEIPGWQTSGATIYTPSAKGIARAKHADGEPVFGNDKPNQLKIVWSTFEADTELSTKKAEVSLDDDLILYIAVNRWVLMTTRGFVKEEGAMDPRTLSAK